MWISGGVRRVRPTLRGFGNLPAMFRAVGGADALVLQREMLPLDTTALEARAVRRSIPVVWDVDDAVWERDTLRRRARGSARKYEWLAAHADEVWAGSRHAVEWADRSGAKEVLWVPTTVGVPPTVSNDDREEDLLAWIGTPSTAPYVEHLLHSITPDLSGWRVLIVGGSISAPSDVRVEQQPWSLEAEATALRRAAVGLYPLDTSVTTTAGKSALKAVLYMAHGVPVIATPTRSNRDVMRHEAEGLFASTADEWRAALQALRDPAARAAMGAAGHRRALSEFDSATWGMRLASRVEALLS